MRFQESVKRYCLYIINPAIASIWVAEKQARSLAVRCLKPRIV